ncbi:hypothetical protein MMC08_009044, partial [Hypocenomyce scalaris]|nr:hypothetical protein [Hypocenomyce scalaris]
MASFQSQPHLQKVRRIVTGHTPEGKSIFDRDEHITPVKPIAASGKSTGLGAGFTLIHQTSGYPVKVQGSADELKVENLHRSTNGGIVCEIVDVPPAESSTPVYVHRNQSLDYVVILKGTINAILDDGAVKTLNEGDVMVQ